MKSRKRDELEFVSHSREFALETGNRRVGEMLFPVEGWRAVIRKQFAGKFGVHSFGEFLRFTQIRLGRFTPEKIGIRRVGDGARDGTLRSRANTEKSFGGAVA